MTRLLSFAAAAVCLVTLPGFPGGGMAAETGLHQDPPVTGHALSYDGTKMIVQRENNGHRSVDFIHTHSGDPFGLTEPSFVSMRWGEDSDTAYATAKDGRIYRISLVTGAADVVPVVLTGKGGIPRSADPRVLSFPTPTVPLLFARGSRSDFLLYRCVLERADNDPEIAARCETADLQGRHTIYWLIATDGHPAARIVLGSSGEHEFEFLTDEGWWRPIFRYLPHYTVFTTIGGVDKDNKLWALSNRNRESVALVRLDAATGREEVVYHRHSIDVDRAIVLFDSVGVGKPLLASHFPGYQEIVHFDARLKAAYAMLRERLDEPVRIDFKSSDLALDFAVVEVLSPHFYRRSYLLNLKSNTFRVLSAGRPAAYDGPAMPSRPVDFRASDGFSLRGYLTLPQGAAGSRPPPMVLMLHGGPWEREYWPGGPLVRFLGSLGYAVLRLNYRGSSGYNRAYLEAGMGALFGRLPQDILDAAAWAVAEGHAPKGRIALFGGSFGGFLALVALSRYPNAFRAGIAVNAPTDAVAFWKRDWSRVGNRAVWRKFMTSHDLPEAALARISPLNNFRSFGAPVLLLTGTSDRRVPPEHSFELFDLLRAAGKRADLVEYRGAGHNIWGSDPKTAEHTAGRIAEFLAEHLPVAQ